MLRLLEMVWLLGKAWNLLHARRLQIRPCGQLQVGLWGGLFLNVEFQASFLKLWGQVKLKELSLMLPVFCSLELEYGALGRNTGNVWSG